MWCKMVECKRCFSEEHVVRNGRIRNKQRYRCMKCGYIFVRGDARERLSKAGKGLAVLLYATKLLKQKEIARMLGVSRSSIQKWTNDWTERIREKNIAGNFLLRR